MKVHEIRESFLNYFAQKGHTRVPSSSLVPHNDPSLLFTNSGMVQFKDVFLGKDKRPYSRATTVQKCLRAGGKHNDLENVGFTARHHTFFEMLGNFSFGDYFKKEAIAYAWEFSTQVLKLPKDRLYVTVFEKDDEAAQIWEQQEKVPKDRIYRFGAKDNFWQMGDTGPCGPCSELFYDRGPAFGCGKPTCAMGCDCDRYMEFWNLVFMQFNRDAAGTLTPLPRPSVDTGAGLERLASILQEVPTNYDIDGFQELFRKAQSLFQEAYQPGKDSAFSYRVIADHARAAAFLIADGVMPSNEGRGYVLRRIIRRAVRHGKNLGRNAPFLYQVSLWVCDSMQEAYPELAEQRTLIEKALFAEEEQFFKTLERGLLILDEALAQKPTQLSGEIAFQLYDTYGFPLDLTRVICLERGIDVDESGFEAAMARQKSDSRKNWKGSGDSSVAAAYFELAQKLEAEGRHTVFQGYEHLELTGRILGGWLQLESGLTPITESIDTSTLPESARIEVVFDQTPFYAEGGGQVADQGEVWGESGSPRFEALVVHVHKPVSNLIVVTLQPKQGVLTLGQILRQSTHARLRALTARNHTATHLLHWALRKTLGSHVKQAGSLVNPELLRLDFSHFQAMTAEQLSEVESLINEKILEGGRVAKEEMSKDDAIAKGAIAFFGEKYGDRVRVVSVGDYSTELCGGTHVNLAEEIGAFVIASESGIAAGVRRIVAHTSQGAIRYWKARETEIKAARDLIHASSTDEVVPQIQRMMESSRDLKKTVERLEAQAAARWVDEIWLSHFMVGETPCLVADAPYDPSGMKRLRELADTLKQRHPLAAVVLSMVDATTQKLQLLTAVGPKAASGFQANEVLKPLLPLFEGKGGGKKDMAQASGPRIDQLQPVLQQARKVLESMNH